MNACREHNATGHTFNAWVGSIMDIMVWHDSVALLQTRLPLSLCRTP